MCSSECLPLALRAGRGPWRTCNRSRLRRSAPPIKKAPFAARPRSQYNKIIISALIQHSWTETVSNFCELRAGKATGDLGGAPFSSRSRRIGLEPYHTHLAIDSLMALRQFASQLASGLSRTQVARVGMPAALQATQSFSTETVSGIPVKVRIAGHSTCIDRNASSTP